MPTHDYIYLLLGLELIATVIPFIIHARVIGGDWRACTAFQIYIYIL